MIPDEIKSSYDRIAAWWRDTHRDSTYGLVQLDRALRFVDGAGAALDVGCGSEGRFLRVLRERGFQPEGLDISPNMIALAKERFSETVFYAADICEWEPPKSYSFISAWDSIFHLQLHQHEPVLRKLCRGLARDGVLMFTCGGGDEPGEVTGSFAGEEFSYSTLGVRAFLSLLDDFGCVVKHLEYDQLPENHVTVIAKKAV